MSDYKLTVELCPESGCGLIQIEKGSLRSKIDLMPDEVLEARELNGEAFSINWKILTMLLVKE